MKIIPLKTYSKTYHALLIHELLDKPNIQHRMPIQDNHCMVLLPNDISRVVLFFFSYVVSNKDNTMLINNRDHNSRHNYFHRSFQHFLHINMDDTKIHSNKLTYHQNNQIKILDYQVKFNSNERTIDYRPLHGARIDGRLLPASCLSILINVILSSILSK